MSQAPGQIVTPEAVVLELDVAGIASRLIARFIDLVLVGLAVYAASIPLVFFAFSGSLTPVILYAIFVAVVLLGYPMLSETFWNGRTVGKRVVGLRVVTVIGEPCRFRHAALRSLLQILDFGTFGFAAMVSALLTRNSQRLGDLAAGTIVIRERAANTGVVPVVFPPPAGWEGYVGSLDAAVVSAVQYEIVRSFLLRVRDLRPDVRVSMANRLATPLTQAMVHNPPQGMPAEFFLVCVAAAYQLRHGGPQAGLAAYAPPAAQGWAG